jgi:hypothetical protein
VPARATGRPAHDVAGTVGTRRGVQPHARAGCGPPRPRLLAGGHRPQGAGQDVFSDPPHPIPRPPTLACSVDRWKVGPFHRYITNSAFVANMVVLANVPFCSMAAYSLARMCFPGRDLVFYLVLAALMIPFEFTLVPSFHVITRLGDVNSYQALLVPGRGQPLGHLSDAPGLPGHPMQAGPGRAARRRVRVHGLLAYRAAAGRTGPGDGRHLGLRGRVELAALADDRPEESGDADPADRHHLPGLQLLRRLAQIAAGSVLSIMPILVIFLVARRYFIAGLTGGAVDG